MKHWNALNELETEVIRVGEFRNLYELILLAVENNADAETLQSGLYTMSGMIDDINTKINEKFHIVFDAIRSEDFKTEHDELTAEQENENGSQLRFQQIVDQLVSTN